MTQHYRVSSGRPEDPTTFCYDSGEAALMRWHYRVTAALLFLNEDDKFLELDTKRNLVTVSNVEAGSVEITVGERCYRIDKCSVCGDTGQDCTGECIELNEGVK